MSKKLLSAATIAVLALVSSLALAACGGGDDNNGSSADQDQIKQAITAAATSGDPAACTKYQTQRFVEQTNSGKGQAAVKSCEKDAKSTAADSIVVTDINVDGDHATAVGDATGSIFDGQTLKVALIKEGGQWKLDEFQGFENFDKDAMSNAFASQAQKEGAPAAAIECVKAQFQKASDQQVEDSFTSSDPQAENVLFGPCEKLFKGG